MVKLRLTRTGRTGRASYRVIAIDRRSKRDGKALEFLGHFDPHTKDLAINSERAQYWLSVGAQPSETVRGLLVKSGVLPKKALSKKKYQAKPGANSVQRSEAKAAKVASKAAEAQAAAEAPAAEPESEPVPEVAASEAAPVETPAA